MNCIFGASGSAREIELLISRLVVSGDDSFRVTHFVVEDGNDQIGQIMKGCPVISETEFFTDHAHRDANCFLGFGSPVLRRTIVERLRSRAKVRFPTLIDPSVIFDRRLGGVCVGEGAIICANTTLTTDIEVGAFVQINNASTVAHDVRIGDFSTLSPGVHVSGNVTLHSGVFVGTGSVILERLEVAATTIIGAGATVARDIPEPGTYVGTPARRIAK